MLLCSGNPMHSETFDCESRGRGMVISISKAGASLYTAQRVQSSSMQCQVGGVCNSAGKEDANSDFTSTPLSEGLHRPGLGRLPDAHKEARENKVQDFEEQVS